MTNSDEREQKRQLALINLSDPYFQLLSTVYYARESEENYGNLLKNLSQEALSNYPSQEAYGELFAKRLLSGEAITSVSLQKDAFSILRSSFEDISVEDACKLLGLEKPLKQNYSGKEISDLKEEEKVILVNAFFSNSADSFAQANLDGRIQDRKSRLEEMLCEKNKDEQNRDAA